MTAKAAPKAGTHAETPLWAPDKQRVEGSQLYAFMQKTGAQAGKDFGDYQSFWRWSVEQPEKFWSAVWDDCGVIGDKGKPVLKDGGKMPGAAFFPEAKINYAENLLRRRDDRPGMIFRDETGRERTLSFADIYNEVSRWAQALQAVGVGKGDRVAGFMPNMPETIIAMLATAALGAIWSSASPDFGVQGVLDRFGQIEPKVLVAVDGYFYNGKKLDCLAKLMEIQPKLKGLQKTVIVPFLHQSNPPPPALAGGGVRGGGHSFAESPKNALPGPPPAGGRGEEEGITVTAADFTAPFRPRDIAFTRVAFNHPLFIMFSSGTTGVPKCIVHGQGGTLLQHLKEHRLQCDIRRDDRVFYFTTCGWMMWNWLVSALASEACLLLYDGSPFHPDGKILWDFTTKHDCTLFGTAAKYIDALKANGIHPGETHDLKTLRTITSTGSPLVHESFDFVYSAIKRDVHLASISGGTDIVSCFVLGNPISPVWRGEIQGAGLGMAVDAFDEEGKPIPAGAGSGELVCTKPFPSMPVGFWRDESGEKYHNAYFARFPNVWVHGDWIERTAHGGFIIHGRSDATLNPGGVRIGTADTRQVEQIPDVLESIAVGQDWDGDVRVVLFVRLREGVVLNDELRDRIRKQIRQGASPRHVPAKILHVADIPRTKSGKITELAVRDVIHGRKVKNSEALANPEALKLYENLGELRD